MKTAKTILFISLLFVFPLGLFATAQIPDKIIFEGKEYKLHTNPLEVFFEKYPEKRPELEFTSTALWRGYVATFEIINNELLLKDIEIEDYDTDSEDDRWKSILKQVFPEPGKIKVDWMDGLLILPYGKMKNYVHMAYATEYSHYKILEISGGNLTKTMKFNRKEYNKFKKKQFELFKTTPEYRETKQKLKAQDPGMTDDFIDSFLKDFVTSYTTKILD